MGEVGVQTGLAEWLRDQISVDEREARADGNDLPVDETAGPQWKAMMRAERSALLEVLRLMAVVYRERDGYRDSWAPDGR